MAYAAHQRQVCPGCGTRPAEWDKDSGGDEDAYVATTHRCIGCQTLADKQASVPQGDEGHGVKVLLLPQSVDAALRFARTHTTHH